MIVRDLNDTIGIIFGIGTSKFGWTILKGIIRHPNGKSRGTWEPSSSDFLVWKKEKQRFFGHYIDILRNTFFKFQINA